MMAGVEIRSFESPDEVRPFEGRGHIDMLRVGGKEIGRAVFEPGWRWSTDVKPIAGTPSCEFPHFLYVLQGRLRVLMDDGEQAELGPGDVATIAPGHDAEVIGDEPCVTLDLGEEDADYARPAKSSPTPYRPGEPAASRPTRPRA